MTQRHQQDQRVTFIRVPRAIVTREGADGLRVTFGRGARVAGVAVILERLRIPLNTPALIL